MLDPKCDLYLEEPVACVDYSSLYPSSMISENISHDSKVWTKEYDLNNELIKETGEKNEKDEEDDEYEDNYKYDNLVYFFIYLTFWLPKNVWKDSSIYRLKRVPIISVIVRKLIKK